MLFYLSIGDSVMPGMISDDRMLYWRALSVAGILELKHPYLYSRRQPSVDLRDISIRHLGGYTAQQLRTRVIPHSRFLNSLRYSKLLQAQRLYDYLNNMNTFYVKTSKSPPPTFPSDSAIPHVKACIRGRKGAIVFADWLNEFIEQQFRMLPRLEATLDARRPPSPPPPAPRHLCAPVSPLYGLPVPEHAHWVVGGDTRFYRYSRYGSPEYRPEDRMRSLEDAPEGYHRPPVYVPEGFLPPPSGSNESPPPRECEKSDPAPSLEGSDVEQPLDLSTTSTAAAAAINEKNLKPTTHRALHPIRL